MCPRGLSVAFISTLFDRLIVCPDVIAYDHYWSELKRCDVSLTYAIYWPDCNTKCYKMYALISTYVCVLSRQHESLLFSHNHAHRCIDANELLFISQTVRWRPSPIHFPIRIHTMHTYLKFSQFSRYDCTNNIEILQTLIILEPVYEFITSDVSTSAVGVFTPVFDLPFRILMPTYL